MTAKKVRHRKDRNERCSSFFIFVLTPFNSLYFENAAKEAVVPIGVIPSILRRWIIPRPFG